MRTRNDILAEYVRKKVSKIPKSIDFALFFLGETMKDFTVSTRNVLYKQSENKNEGGVDDVCDLP